MTSTPLLLALVPLVAGCAPPGAGIDAEDRVHLELLLQPRYSDPSGRDLTPTFDLVVDLRDDGSAVVALDTRPDPAPTIPRATSWTHTEGRIVIEAFELTAPSGERLFVERTIVELVDPDEGDPLRGQGGATGQVEWLRGDVMSTSEFDARVTATADTTGPRAALAWWTPRLPIPGRIRIVFTEPVPETDLEAIAITTGGEAIDGEITGIGAVGGLVAQAAFTPVSFLPFDAEIRLDPVVADPAGNPATATGPPLRTPPDPGSASANAGFEHGLEGWTATGDVSARGPFGGLAPARGPGQAVVRSGGSLVGYLDVPPGASTLEISVGVLSEIGQYEAGRSGLVRLHTPAGDVVVFDASGDAGPAEACEGCKGYGVRHPPVRAIADLVPHRGTRVFLSVSATASGYLGMNEYAVVVDDVSLR